MNDINKLKSIYNSKHEHFIFVEFKFFKRWKWIIKLIISLNKNYKYCEIFRKKYKSQRNFVVVALKWSGKNVKRRTSGYAKEFISHSRNPKCIYCQNKLTYENATAEHILPISHGGNNTQVNLIVCCHDCNSERGNINFFKYLKIKNPFFRKIKYPFV